MNIQLSGLGTAVPPRILKQTDAAELSGNFCAADSRQARALRMLYGRSGVETRNTVVLESDQGTLKERVPFYPAANGPKDRGPTTGERMAWYETEAPPLAEAAARQALENASTPVDAITHLVTVSCTGFFSPGLDAVLINELGLPRTVHRTHVGFMGCHGALNGLRVAGSQAEEAEARILLCAVELCSLHFAYGWDPEMMVANTLFADGAAAVVGVPARNSENPTWSVRAQGAFLMPLSGDAMSWRIGDHGFRMTLSAAVPELIRTNLGGWLRDWLKGQGFGLNDIGSWAVHPGGPRILEAVADALSLEAKVLDVSRTVLRHHGNMSSPTVLFILDKLKKTGATLPCVALAFGPGLVVEAMLVV
ncbi:MAG: type III polyketide synthase [Gemmatimonadota bacterium]|nr:type III polyketide synthase [Gemmatimonadota bacterium]